MPDKSQPVSKPAEKMFVTFDPSDRKAAALAYHEAARGLKRVEPIVRTQGSNIYQNIAPGNVSIRDGYSRDDYQAFRWDDWLPRKPKDILLACMQAYERVGIVRNIVDLMADFGSQGIDLKHPNERIEKWWKEWFRRVNGRERSERFLNLLYRTGNVIVKRQTAKIPVKVEDQMKRASGSANPPDGVDLPDEPKLSSREIPWKYVFFNPLSVEVLGDELATFVGQDVYSFAVRVPETLAKKIREPKNKTERDLVKLIPATVRQLVLNGQKAIPLDPKTVLSFYYKKDDWELWARPMVFAILSDIKMLEKMKLADMSALDGAISCIRVWKLGNIEAGILPTDAAINRLAEMLCNNVGGGVMDLVWGPEIDLVETSTEVHKFLGQTKYEPVLTAIYAGLGIPPTLTGASTASGFTNNYISLKTLTERLEYGRAVLRAFWEAEIRIVQKQMGFRFPATLTYDHISFTDENAEKALLIQLLDRMGVSDETIQERFGLLPDIEDIRIRREQRRRDNGQKPSKASPFHTVDAEHDLKKAFIQMGTVTPSEVGLELDAKKRGEKSPIDATADAAPPSAPPAQSAKPKGQPGQGRPKNAKDSTKRKQKTVTPRSSAAFFGEMTKAENAQGRIGQLVQPAYLKSVGKKTARELTEEETGKFERFKFALLCNTEPGQAIDEKAVAKLLAKPLTVPATVLELLKTTIAKHVENHGKEPTLEVLRRYQAGVYALWKGEFDDEEASHSDDGL